MRQKGDVRQHNRSYATTALKAPSCLCSFVFVSFYFSSFPAYMWLKWTVFSPWQAAIVPKILAYLYHSSVEADSRTETQETNGMLFIPMKMCRYITIQDFKALHSDLYMTGNKTFCQKWSRNEVVSEIDVNGFWRHLTDSTWLCYRNNIICVKTAWHNTIWVC